MFEFIYELLCGKNADPVYGTDVYPSVGLFTLLFAFIFALVFYVWLGRWRPVWDKLSHWVVTLLMLAGIAFYFALSQAKGATGEDSDSFMFKFSLVNALMAAIYFIILSLLLKKASIFAKRTPF